MSMSSRSSLCCAVLCSSTNASTCVQAVRGVGEALGGGVRDGGAERNGRPGAHPDALPHRVERVVHRHVAHVRRRPLRHTSHARLCRQKVRLLILVPS